METLTLDYSNPQHRLILQFIVTTVAHSDPDVAHRIDQRLSQTTDPEVGLFNLFLATKEAVEAVNARIGEVLEVVEVREPQSPRMVIRYLYPLFQSELEEVVAMLADTCPQGEILLLPPNLKGNWPSDGIGEDESPCPLRDWAIATWVSIWSTAWALSVFLGYSL